MNYLNGSMESYPLAKRKPTLPDAVHGASRADKRSRSKVPGSSSRRCLDDGTSLQALGVEALQRLLKERQR